MKSFWPSASEAARELLLRRHSRKRLLSFVCYTKKDYRINWHHRLLAERLDQLLAGAIRRLVVVMPPRHGKTELVSRRLPAFFLGREPAGKVICCSHTAELATQISRQVKRIMASAEYRRLFPQTVLGTKRTGAADRADYWETTAGGYFRAAGVGGAITGMGADLLVVDDPVKSAAEAESRTWRERTWRWFARDFLSRGSPQARVVVVSTRWHRDDLVGRILKQERERWHLLHLPALREPGLPNYPEDPREEGQMLWPQVLSLAEAQAIRQRDPAGWAALYQGSPRAEGGAEWPEECWGDWLWTGELPPPEAFLCRVLAVDPSMGAAERSDYSALVWAGLTKEGLLVVQAQLERLSPTELVRRVLGLLRQWPSDALAVEANAFQQLLALELQRQLAGSAVPVPVYEVKNTVPKAVRIRRLGPWITMRRLRLVRSTDTELLCEQLRDFPLGEHDDGPDALEMALRVMHEVYGVLQ